ncbi:putative transcription factor WD40-like family [Helianthus annuus]|nr:putative transcription factor WD40-like family [Helianthus annuus]KAJ0784151.1 putative transcription factor WD40-like family [Helianthus annuus]
MSSSTARRPKHTVTVPKTTTLPPSKTTRTTTPSSKTTTFTGKENANVFRSTSRTRAASKPLLPPVARTDKESVEPRARWSTSVSVQSRGRSSSPCEFNRINNIITSDMRKPRVSVDRNARSVSVDRPARASNVPDSRSSYNIGFKSLKTSVLSLDKSSELVKDLKPKGPKLVKTRSARVSTVSDENCSLDSVPKVSETVKLFEKKFRSKSCVGLRSGSLTECEENGIRSSFGNSSGKLSRGSGSDGSKEKKTSEDSLSAKYPSKLHGKLAFLEEKVKRIASDIKRTKEMLDLNNPDASKVMLSDIQDSVEGIEKAMGDVVSGEIVSDNLQINTTKRRSSIKESSDSRSSAKGLNTDELEARFFPHHKLLRDRSTLKAPLGSHKTFKTEAVLAITKAKQHENSSAPVLSDLSSKEESKVTVRDGLEICRVEETDSTVNTKEQDSLNTYDGKEPKGNVETMLTAYETLEECDEEENKTVMIHVEEIDDSFNNQLNEIGHKNSTGGWFVSEGESVLLAHDDGSCTFYDVVNSEVKSTYEPSAEVSTNLWRDCWIVRAPGADGCSGRYVVAASAGNRTDAGFCSWDFYTKEVKSFHIDEVTNTSSTSNRQWWYKPCGPLIISTTSNQKGVRVYDIRDGEHVSKWDVQSFVLSMENSSPLQWRNRGKVVLAESGGVCLWDLGSITPEPLLSVSANGKKISALHVNNTDAELGGGVRQRVSSSEAEGNDGVFCTSDSITVLDFRHPAGIGLKIPKDNTTAHSVFSHGDSIYLGCSGSPSATKKPPSSAQIQQFSLRKQKLFTTYTLPESNTHYKAITQVWGNSNFVMGVCGSGMFVFDALKDDDSRGDHGNCQKLRETIGPDSLYCPSFDYLGSRALLISRDRPAVWKYLA